jgi:hypothetical protein
LTDIQHRKFDSLEEMAQEISEKTGQSMRCFPGEMEPQIAFRAKHAKAMKTEQELTHVNSEIERVEAMIGCFTGRIMNNNTSLM